ncbi:TPA: hypothetical protein NIA45_004678 [Pseudomonas aeruginosa]|nr:hypothetical protein [Pseudomonas aeruginosa]
MSSVLIITTAAGIKLTLRPVPMSIRPSDTPSLWLKFQGAYVAGGGLSDESTDQVQRFMRQNQTEALFDGHRNLTIAGNGLAICFPDRV